MLICNELDLRPAFYTAGNQLLRVTRSGSCFQEITIFIASPRTVPPVTPKSTKRGQRTVDSPSRINESHDRITTTEICLKLSLEDVVCKFRDKW